MAAPAGQPVATMGYPAAGLAVTVLRPTGPAVVPGAGPYPGSGRCYAIVRDPPLPHALLPQGLFAGTLVFSAIMC